MSDVVHIPQTAASHQYASTKQYSDSADMLREDPRDTTYQGEQLSLSLTYAHLHGNALLV